jgi:hypothetical protein
VTPDSKLARMAVVCVSLAAASYILYMAAALLLIVPGNIPHSLREELMPALFAFVALTLDCDAAYLLLQHCQKRFPVLLLFSFLINGVGAILCWVIIWRGHSFEVIR